MSPEVSMSPDEGYVKYQCHHSVGPSPEHAWLDALDELRTYLFDADLVGQLPDGVGFGNLSVRAEGQSFVISATGTGGVRCLGCDGYCVVHACDIDANTVSSCGPLQASSEAMSHAAVYTASPLARCVAHIHSHDLFYRLLKEGALATLPGAAFGTPDMARSVAELVCQHPLEGVLVMSGHEDGILVYGPSVDSVTSQLAFLQRNYLSRGGALSCQKEGSHEHRACGCQRSTTHES